MQRIPRAVVNERWFLLFVVELLRTRHAHGCRVLTVMCDAKLSTLAVFIRDLS